MSVRSYPGTNGGSIIAPSCDVCQARATTCAHVALGGGYGQPERGSMAFYYTCDEHSTRKVGDHTDMSRVVLVRRLAGA